MVETMTTSTELATLNRFRSEIENIQTIDQALNTTNQLDILRYALKKAGHSHRLQNEAAALKLRAEYQAGTLIDQLIPEKSHPGSPTYEDYNIHRETGRRLRNLSRINKDELEQYIANSYARNDEITRAAALRLRNNTQKKVVNQIHFVAPSVTEEVAQNITDGVTEALFEFTSAAITSALQWMTEARRERQALIWAKYWGINDDGTQGDRWTFARIALLVPNAQGQLTTREYIEQQYYRADSAIIRRCYRDALLTLAAIANGDK